MVGLTPSNDSRTTRISILVVILSHLSRRRYLLDALQRGIFYLGVVAMLLLIPVTLPLVFLLMRKYLVRGTPLLSLACAVC